MKLPKFDWSGGDEVATVHVYGDPKRQPEPETLRVVLPFGDVDITRCTDGGYWIHVRRATGQPGETCPQVGVIDDARLDIEGRHTSDVDVGEFADPKLYHVAIRLAPKAVTP